MFKNEQELEAKKEQLLFKRAILKHSRAIMEIPNKIVKNRTSCTKKGTLYTNKIFHFLKIYCPSGIVV